MTLIRWSPAFRSTRHGVHDDIGRLVESLLSNRSEAYGPTPFAPAVDIEETPEAFVLRADLPGISQKDVRLSIMGDTLVLRGERKAAEARAGANLHRVERPHGTFERTFTLGTPVRSEQVKATYRDGVLEILVPKAEEARMRDIEVQVG